MHDDTAPAAQDNPVQRRHTDMHGVFRAGEPRRVTLTFSAFFLILCGYTILRPVRDAMGVQYGADRLQWLFSATFVFTLLAVPLFGWVVRTVARAHVLPLVYGFLAVNLLGFHALFSTTISMGAAAAFFVWLSVINLFVVSLFWSNVGDCFTTAESHRLYGYIAAGGTIGAVAGPAITVSLATRAGTANLLALSAMLLVAAALCVSALRSCSHTTRSGDVRPVGGPILAGIPLAVRSPALRSIMLLVLCYTAVSTVLYVELAALVGERYAAPEERTRFFATVDLAVNILALTLQILGTRRLVRHGGVRVALSVVPAMMLAGLGTLGAWRNAIGFAFVQTLHRAGEYAFNKPGREMIYTTVDAEARYKAKNFIDTLVYRAGDAANAWMINAIRAAGADAVWLVAMPAAAVWLVTGFLLGGRHDKHEPA